MVLKNINRSINTVKKYDLDMSEAYSLLFSNEVFDNIKLCLITYYFTLNYRDHNRLFWFLKVHKELF